MGVTPGVFGKRPRPLCAVWPLVMPLKLSQLAAFKAPHLFNLYCTRQQLETVTIYESLIPFNQSSWSMMVSKEKQMTEKVNWLKQYTHSFK